ncbi:MAG: hypothetical protein ABI378_11265 [Chitinophagaceae bacterium]
MKLRIFAILMMIGVAFCNTDSFAQMHHPHHMAMHHRMHHHRHHMHHMHRHGHMHKVAHHSHTTTTHTDNQPQR